MKMQISAGLFVLALSFAGAARADNNSLPMRNSRSDAQDGRGDTVAQSRASRSESAPSVTSSSRALWQGSQDSRRPDANTNSSRALWQGSQDSRRPTTEAKNAPAPALKADIQVRVGEGGDHDAKLPGAAAKPSEQSAASQHTSAAKLPIKSEVMIRLGELHEESTPTLQGKTTKATSAVSKAQGLKNMPVKVEIQMQIQDASGGDDTL